MEILTPLDYVILTVLGISTVIALLRGFAREVLSIVSWILATYIALYALLPLRPIARNYIGPDWLADGVILVLVFILVMVICAFISHKIVARLQKSGISFMDRILGALFGLARGVLIAVFAYFFLLLLVPTEAHPNWIKQARFLPHLQSGTSLVTKLVPLDNLSENLPPIDDMLDPTRLPGMTTSGTDQRDTPTNYRENLREGLDSLLRGVRRDKKENDADNADDASDE